MKLEPPTWVATCKPYGKLFDFCRILFRAIHRTTALLFKTCDPPSKSTPPRGHRLNIARHPVCPTNSGHTATPFHDQFQRWSIGRPVVCSTFTISLLRGNTFENFAISLRPVSFITSMSRSKNFYSRPLRPRPDIKLVKAQFQWAWVKFIIIGPQPPSTPLFCSSETDLILFVSGSGPLFSGLSIKQKYLRRSGHGIGGPSLP